MRVQECVYGDCSWFPQSELAVHTKGGYEILVRVVCDAYHILFMGLHREGREREGESQCVSKQGREGGRERERRGTEVRWTHKALCHSACSYSDHKKP